MKEMKYPNLFAPLQVNGVMLKNRVIAAPMGVPRAMLLSSTYYGGISLPDKAQGGSSAIVVSSYGTADIAKCSSPFDKYARDVTRETWSLIEESGAVGVMEFSFHPLKNDQTFGCYLLSPWCPNRKIFLSTLPVFELTLRIWGDPNPDWQLHKHSTSPEEQPI